MTFELERIVAEKYAPDDVDKALVALAYNGGQARRACKDLLAGGLKVPESTLKGWRESYPNRYRQHMTTLSRRVEEEAAVGFLEIIHQAQDAMKDAVELEHSRIRRGDIRDASSSGRNLSVIAGLAGTKLLELTQRPTQIIENRRPEDIMRRLQSLGVIEGTAVEAPPSGDQSDAA